MKLTAEREFKVGDWFTIDGIRMKIDVILGDDKYRMYSPLGYRGFYKEVSEAELFAALPPRHTEGPWHLNKSISDQIALIEVYENNNPDHNIIILSLKSGEGNKGNRDGEFRANALLAASAPDLLRMLQNFISLSEVTRNSKAGWDTLTSFIDQFAALVEMAKNEVKKATIQS